MANPADDGLEGLFSSKNLYANVCLCPSTGVAPLLPFFWKTCLQFLRNLFQRSIATNRV